MLSVYCVAVRTIVLSRHGINLARPVIIHDSIYSLKSVTLLSAVYGSTLIMTILDGKLFRVKFLFIL